MKVTFNKKTNMSRKGLLWLYFLGILLLAAALAIVGYFILYKEKPAINIEKEIIKIEENELKKLEGYKDLEAPIDLNTGLGKIEPFKY